MPSRALGLAKSISVLLNRRMLAATEIARAVLSDGQRHGRDRPRANPSNVLANHRDINEDVRPGGDLALATRPTSRVLQQAAPLGAGCRGLGAASALTRPYECADRAAGVVDLGKMSIMWLRPA